MRQIIDLTHEMHNAMQGYPTDPPFSKNAFKTISEQGSNVSKITFGTHTGTHVDAPSHVLSEAKNLSAMPLSSFFGKAVCLKEQALNKFKKKEIDGVVLNTGWYKNFGYRTYYSQQRPAIELCFVEALLDLGIRFFGCDLPSVDVSGSKDKVIHKMLLENGVAVYENLTNLDALEDLDSFMFYGFPLSIRSADASPVRAVAIV